MIIKDTSNCALRTLQLAQGSVQRLVHCVVFHVIIFVRGRKGLTSFLERKEKKKGKEHPWLRESATPQRNLVKEEGGTPDGISARCIM